VKVDHVRSYEEIGSTDPFEGRFTFLLDGDELSVTADDDLSVVERSNRQVSMGISPVSNHH
jgi:hypothetical protein